MMALLKLNSFNKLDKSRNYIHKPVTATYSVFQESGQKIFQIDTYGSIERAMPEKISQSIQIDNDMAQFIFDLLKKEFRCK